MDRVLGWVVIEPPGVVVQYLQPGPSFSSVRRVGYRTVVVGLVTTSCQDRGNFLETPYPPQLERLLREERNPSLLANHQVSRMINMTIVSVESSSGCLASPLHATFSSRLSLFLRLSVRVRIQTPGETAKVLQVESATNFRKRLSIRRGFCHVLIPFYISLFRGNVLRLLKFYLSFDLSVNELRISRKVI